jgi:hypothetical protein
MILFISPRIQRSKLSFVGYLQSVARLISWESSTGFLGSTSPGDLPLWLLPYTSLNLAFATNLVKSFHLSDKNQTPTATPYCSGIPIDVVAASDEADDSLALKCHKEAYQSLIRSIGWLVHLTRPDLITVHSFLASYSNKSCTGHMKVALHALHYIHSTHDYGISFTSKSVAPMHSYIHYPPSTDVEAYQDATPPKSHDFSTLSSYSNACWGSQIGNAVAEGTLLPLFKFCSMSGGIAFRNGSPLGWLRERQDCTSLSSCEAKICATSATSKKVVDLCNLSLSFMESGFSIADINKPTLLYNDNDACVKWSHNMTSKAARHIELCKNPVRKWVQYKTITVKHVASKINPADIFTKEMRGGTHFRRLRDSFMSRLLDFLTALLMETHHARQRSPNLVSPSTAWVTLASGTSLCLSSLAANTFCWSATLVSHLCSAGQQLV